MSVSFLYLQYSIEGSQTPPVCRAPRSDVADVDTPVQQAIRNTETKILQI